MKSRLSLACRPPRVFDDKRYKNSAYDDEGELKYFPL